MAVRLGQIAVDVDIAYRSAETGLVELVITQIGSLEVHWLFTDAASNCSTRIAFHGNESELFS